LEIFMILSKRLLPFVGLVGIAALSACGTSNNTTSSSSGGSGNLSSCTGSISVATDLPLTGGDATDGPPVQQAAQLAVEQANTNKTLGGCTLKYTSKDDATVAANGHDPVQGKANLTALAADPTVVGVVGPFNSGVALAEIPVASQNHLAMISPSNTNPGLTQVGTNPAIDTASLYPGVHTYFRTIATDTNQAEILAYVATKELNATKAYAIDDGQTYGRGLRLLFEKYFTADGGTIVDVGQQSLPAATKDFSTQVSDAQSKQAQVIFFGGTSGTGCGLLRSFMSATLPLLGGDGCQDAKFITDAAANANGAEATSAPDVSKVASSQQFNTDFKNRFGADAYANSPYTPYGYDAMNILIQAIKSVLLANGGQPPSDSTTFRDQVVAQLHKVQYSGAVGQTSFDTNGDTTNTGFTLYKVSGGAWTAKEKLVVDTSGKVSVATS
jgi:branched-chain amino acid transport system substrate-binding protein